MLERNIDQAIKVIKRNLCALTEEFKKVEDYLKQAIGYAIAYNNESQFYRMSLRTLGEIIDEEFFLKVKAELDECDREYWKKFTFNIQFEKFREFCINCDKNQKSVVVYLWNVEQMLQYLQTSFQIINSIKNEEEKDLIIKSLLVCG